MAKKEVLITKCMVPPPYFILKITMTRDKMLRPSAFVSQKTAGVATTMTKIHAILTNLTGNLIIFANENKKQQ